MYIETPNDSVVTGASFYKDDINELSWYTVLEGGQDLSGHYVTWFYLNTLDDDPNLTPDKQTLNLNTAPYWNLVRDSNGWYRAVT